MATITVAQFKIDFPEFDTGTVTDPNKVSISDSQINFWMTIAFAMIDPSAARWGGKDTTIYNLGIELFTAHNVILEVLAQRDMDVGGVPGVATGTIAGKSAGDVAISYNSAAPLELDGGHWNYTAYGQRFLRLARMMGAGPIQVGVGCGPGAGAWPGPFPFPTPESPQ